ncbi:hypothetical protein [Macrococcus equi]|uniref:hypothetical protein n=1 Tax=Macrococcus equi TaxID=3395462 RepID=UPI0039BE25D6
MNIIITLIIAAEILFWVFIVLGLFARYIFHKPTLSKILLSSTIVVDLFLLIITTIHLYNGGNAEIAHGIAAVYIAVSVTFGKQMIGWLDEKFQTLLLNKQPLPKKHGKVYAVHYLKSFVRHIIAFIIAFMLITFMQMIANNESANVLSQITNTWQVVLFIDLIITISYFLWPKKAKQVKQI